MNQLNGPTELLAAIYRCQTPGENLAVSFSKAKGCLFVIHNENVYSVESKEYIGPKDEVDFPSLMDLEELRIKDKSW